MHCTASLFLKERFKMYFSYEYERINLFFLSPFFPARALKTHRREKGAAAARGDDATGWRGDYKEPASDEIKQGRNHKFIKVPNLGHRIKAREAAECATKAATPLSPHAPGHAARSLAPPRGGKRVFCPQWGRGGGDVGSEGKIVIPVPSSHCDRPQ